MQRLLTERKQEGLHSHHVDGAVHVSTSAGSTAMADLVLGGAARGATTALSTRRIYIEI